MMISGSSTRPPRSSSPRPAWSRLLAALTLALALGLGLGACTNELTSIGVGLPGANANTGAYLVDTLTVRSSTVLRDSVVTSNSASLLVGTYTDPLLGTLTAKSYLTVGLTDNFVPDGTFAYDSLVLTLPPTSGSTAYRYGDTTKTQTLVSVYKLLTPLPTTKVIFSSPKLSPLGGYNPVALNQRTPMRRASPMLGTLRIRLADSLGRRLMLAGQQGRIRTAEQLQALVPGLVLASDQTNAAMLTFTANSSSTALTLYYHDPASPTTALSTAFLASSGTAHCFQVQRGTDAAIRNLPTTPLLLVPAAQTGEQTIVEGALGLQTKLEFPYLADLKQYGQNLVITSAQLTAEVPPSTLTPYLPAPPSLQPYVSNGLNQPTATYGSPVTYNGNAVSSTTTLTQGQYSFPVLTYIQAVLANNGLNNGLLLAPSGTPELPTRVILASQRGQTSKLRLQVYIISTN